MPSRFLPLTILDDPVVAGVVDDFIDEECKEDEEEGDGPVIPSQIINNVNGWWLLWHLSDRRLFNRRYRCLDNNRRRRLWDRLWDNRRRLRGGGIGFEEIGDGTAFGADPGPGPESEVPSFFGCPIQSPDGSIGGRREERN